MSETTMCDDRERLISYIYGETDIRERREVDAHLATCAACRAEVASLRTVREDLLAWDVPEHGSVWQPFAPARPATRWRDLPTWGLAAAASLLLVAGGAGGAATQALWLRTPAPMVVATAPETAPAPAAPATASPMVPAMTPVTMATPDALTRDDLAALEARVLERMRAEMDARVLDAQIDVARLIDSDLRQLRTRQVTLEQRNQQNNFILTSMFAGDGNASMLGR